MCIRIHHTYACGHVVSEKAPCAASRSVSCGDMKTKNVKHNNGKCDRCEHDHSQDYKTPEEFINKIVLEDRVSFDSITWEWEIPIVLTSDIQNDVILMCNHPRTELFRTSGYVRALTFKEYLERSRWANFIMELLHLLNKTKLDTTHSAFSLYVVKDPLVSVTCSHTKLSINFGSKRNCLAILDLVEVLDWLCKAMRTPSTKDGHIISLATYRLERDVTMEGHKHSLAVGAEHSFRPVISLSLTPLPDIEHSCWLSLFDSCIIVSSPLIPHDGFGKGLEISFDLMLALAAASHCLKINDSLVFVGYQTVLYPVATYGESAQFHLVTISQGQINPYTLDLKNALPADDTSQFKTKKCFVGWCEVAHINLGTRRLAASVGYSGGRDQPRSLESDGYALLGQFGASAPLSAMMGLQKNFRYSRHRIRFTPTNNYLKLLHDSSQQSVALYDATERRCWLVPKLSLLLYMGQVYISSFAAGQCKKMPYVEPHTDAMEIINALEGAGQTSVLEGQTCKLLLQELLFAISVNLLHTADAVRDSDRGKLYGFEFMDVIREPGKGTCMKRLDIQSRRTAWFDVVNAVGTVIVCSKLGEVITAAKGDTRESSACNKLPQHHDYLAATFKCLERLAEQSGGDPEICRDHIRIAEKAVWKVKGDPFKPCTHEENSNDTCWERPDSIQQLARPQRLSHLIGRYPTGMQPRLKFPITSALVFR